MVPRRALLLVGGLLLLVDHDQADLAEGREERRPRAHHDIGGTVEDAAPLVEALARRQLAVQEGDAVAEPGHEARCDLRRQCDLGHQDDHPKAARDRLARGPQVHLGLPARGHAMKQEAPTGPDRRIDRRHRGCLGPRRRSVPRGIVLGEPELDRDPPHPARAPGREPARDQALRGLYRPTRIREFGAAHRSRSERAKRDELARAEARRQGRKGLVAGRRDREDRLGALTAGGGETGPGPRGQRRWEHGPHRVGEPAAIGRGDPAGEGQLLVGEQRDGMHETLDRLELHVAVRRITETDDDPVDGAWTEAGAHEVTESQVKPFRDAVGEGARGTAKAGEDGDLRRADHVARARSAAAAWPPAR